MPLMFDDSDFSPEQDPIAQEGDHFVATESSKNSLQEYKKTGSVLTVKTMNGLRSELLEELRFEVSSKKMAEKFAQLLDANKEIYDSEGNLIAHMPDNRTQLQTLKLLTEVRGDTAPVKSVHTRVDLDKMNFVLPESHDEE